MSSNGSGLRDFWRVYDEHYDEIIDQVLHVAREHPEFGPAIGTLDPEALAGENTGSRELLRTAIDGDWQPYEAHLRQQGTAYAALGVSFKGWHDLVSGFTSPLVPKLVGDYAAEPERLTCALSGMQEYLGRVMSVIGEAYLAGMKAAQRGEEKFRGLLEAAPDPVVISSKDGRIRIVNARTEELFGFSRDELVGQSVDVLIPERFREQHWRHRKAHAAASEGVEADARLELFGQRSDGSEFPIEISLSPIHTREGVLVSSAVRDISKRKEAEREREAAAEKVKRLAAALAQRATDLEALNKELEAFAYSVSHDLRTPLRALDGFSQALVANYADRPLDERGQDYLQRISRASQKMGHLIDDLLKLSRLSRVEMIREPIELGEIARNIAAELAEMNPERVVTMDISPDMSVRADAELMKVALSNLIGNAWKFTSRRDEANIEVGVEEIDGQRAYFVRDDGAGFDMAYADQLFGVFQRLHSEREFEGTGVGLATVQRVIARHGGRVWADASPGQGATFYFTLASGNA